MDIYICKIPLENLPGESVPVYTTWTDNSFSINIFHRDKALAKSVSEVDLKSLCGFTQSSVEEYLLETKRALTCDGGCAEFTYSLIKSEFQWKKIIDDNIKIKFGSLLLEEIPVSSFAGIAVDFLLNRCITLSAKNNSLKKENHDLRTANTSLRTHVCTITKLKKDMEEALYNKSLAVLNTKKEKISELQRIIETRPTTSGITVDSDHKDGAGFATKLSDLSGSETELDTDENSDFESSKRSSLGANCLTGDKNEMLPAPSKSQKLDFTLSSIKSESSTKGLNESRGGGNNNDDAADIFLPVRRRKNINR
ncbi:DNA repair protein XRCC4-like [Hetaerina americana]|uniref:DNA repair protein XRCC4-like n=1 Tax=Hetaerina americana TaxID=62018 RepID=UPI003A7F1689